LIFKLNAFGDMLLPLSRLSVRHLEAQNPQLRQRIPLLRRFALFLSPPCTMRTSRLKTRLSSQNSDHAKTNYPPRHVPRKRLILLGVSIFFAICLYISEFFRTCCTQSLIDAGACFLRNKARTAWP